MLPAERQTYIKEMIQTKSHLKISELSNLLGVSNMTIHRDVKPLVREGSIVKTFGGISASGQPSPRNHNDAKKCICCHNNIHERMSFHLILTDHTMEKACCAHCGLIRYRQLEERRLSHAICHDFLSEMTIDAHMTYYVMDTSIHVSCCTPQVLTFASREHAQQFVKGFGGVVHSFTEAIECLHRMMVESRSGHQVKKATNG